MDESVDLLLEPAAAAEALRVSPSGLRRLAPIYEAIYEELPRRGSGNEDKRARLWSQTAVERLIRARALVDADKHRTVKRYRTIGDALQAIKEGIADDAPSVLLQGAPEGTAHEAFTVVLSELRDIKRELAELRQRDEARALPSTQPDARSEGDAAQQQPFSESMGSMAERVARADDDGVLVRLARRLERLLGRKRP